MEHPWITTAPDAMIEASYGFKRKVRRHIQHGWKITSADGEALLWIRIVDDHLTVPYYIIAYPGGQKETTAGASLLHLAARSLILEKMVEHRVPYLTIHHPDLAGLMGIRTNPFLFSKPMPQNYFVHRSLVDQLPENLRVQDGDGDVVFT